MPGYAGTEYDLCSLVTDTHLASLTFINHLPRNPSSPLNSHTSPLDGSRLLTITTITAYIVGHTDDAKNKRFGNLQDLGLHFISFFLPLPSYSHYPQSI